MHTSGMVLFIVVLFFGTVMLGAWLVASGEGDGSPRNTDDCDHDPLGSGGCEA
ncbi:hypothetical protein OG625_28970 [Streptomyces sp. NBC_01351]|uniref:hypothetical protein n=1 Tax=Streptomyces sp. NBC_01351 TaxID=2903833 RepID=UPI002E30CAC5|nr:hypothetical protein [Streptomyces sp. NBC_01351]